MFETREKTREKILNAISTNKLITTEELSETTMISTKGVEYHLQKLKKEGCIIRIGPDKGGSWEIIKS